MHIAYSVIFCQILRKFIIIMNLIICYCIAIASILLFLKGFFPLQLNRTWNSTAMPTSLFDLNLQKNNVYKQEMDKIVFIVIDALRLDFINAQNVPFMFSVYQDKGCMLTVHTQSPTVTLPRIKALTTGSVPQFLDIVFNLAGTEVLTDSILHKAKEAGKRIVFYGDDTWLKLYPNIFTRSEGVSSFFVNDYTEVDYNVTRNVVKELNNKDWDIMILHYLGLDHIGHLYDPYSILIQPKLKEMDEVVKMISQSLDKIDSKTLLLITGDHGMKDSGGHGGSTFSETHVPLLIIGHPCKDGNVEQTDIPPTFVSLLGLPYPSDNIGKVISNMFVKLPYERLLYILHYNAVFLKAKLNHYKVLFEEALSMHYSFLKNGNETKAVIAKELYENFSTQLNNKLLRLSVKQDLFTLFIGIGCLITIFFEVLYNYLVPVKGSSFIPNIILSIILLSEITVSEIFLLRIFHLLVLCVLNATYIIWIAREIKWKLNCSIHLFVIIASIVYPFLLFSSSFIEEEHQIWYFFFGTFLILNWFETKLFMSMLPFVMLRFIRTLNQTGDKWAHLPDLSQWLLLDENYLYLQILYVISLMSLIFCYIVLTGKGKFRTTLNIVTGLLIYILKMHSNVQNTLLVVCIWILIILNLFCSGQYFERFIITWSLLSALIMHPYNVVLIPICILTSLTLSKQISNMTTLSLIHIWLGRTLFFCQGHSNSLASVDIATGYIGMKEYTASIVITQVICHTYAFPILTSLLLLRNSSSPQTVWVISILCRLSTLVITCIIILINHNHLFVWTVFAPKLLIESSHTAILFIELLAYYFITTLCHVFIQFKNKYMMNDYGSVYC